MNDLEKCREIMASAEAMRAYGPGDAGRTFVEHLKLLEAMKLEELTTVLPQDLQRTQGAVAQLRALRLMFVTHDEDGRI